MWKSLYNQMYGHTSGTIDEPKGGHMKGSGFIYYRRIVHPKAVNKTDGLYIMNGCSQEKFRKLNIESIKLKQGIPEPEAEPEPAAAEPVQVRGSERPASKETSMSRALSEADFRKAIGFK